MERTHLRLTLDVKYNRAGVSAEALKGFLDAVVVDALNYGGLTGDTPATVDEYRYRVSEVKAS